jgi:hypothetical protein
MKAGSRVAVAVLLLASLLQGCAHRERRGGGDFPGVKHRGWADWEEDHYQDWWNPIMQ